MYLHVIFSDHISIIMTEETPATPVSAALKSVSNTPVSTSSPLRSKDVLLPLARVKTIMKSSPDVDNIGQESLFLVTKVFKYLLYIFIFLPLKFTLYHRPQNCLSCT